MDISEHGSDIHHKVYIPCLLPIQRSVWALYVATETFYIYIFTNGKKIRERVSKVLMSVMY